MAGVYLVSFFTNIGVPQTGLSPTIRVRLVNTGALLINDAVMTEVGDGFYQYFFSTYDPDNDYAIRSDGGAVLEDFERYVFTTNEVGQVTAALDQEALQQVIWDVDLDDHDIAGTPGAVMNDLEDFTVDFQRLIDIQYGRWKIDVNTNQMIYYKEDNTTEVARFDLKNDLGAPATRNVFERVKV